MRVYEQLDILSENREPPKGVLHSLWFFGKSIKRENGESKFYRLLNGDGNFRYFESEYDVPYVPDFNPCGIYRTSFEIDEEWNRRKTCIVFEGVSSCVFLYVNGTYVGYSQGSHLQAEFDISTYWNNKI